MIISTVKVIAVGAAKTGKTKLLQRLKSEGYNETYERGEAFKLTRHRTKGDINFSIWELSGDDRYNEVRTPYISGAQILCLNFSYDDPASLERLAYYLKLAKKEARNAKFIVVGSKADLPEHEKKVTDDMVSEFLQTNAGVLGNDYQFVTVDAKSDVRIKEDADGSKTFCSALDTLAKTLNSPAKNNQVKKEYFPKSYTSLSKLPRSSEGLVPLQKLRLQVLKVLEDYSGYRPVLGIFSKAGFFHRGRHHRQDVKEIINNFKLTSSSNCSVKQITDAYAKLCLIIKKPGGSLDRRVQFIKHLITESEVKFYDTDLLYDLNLLQKQNYNRDASARIQYEPRP